MSGEGVGSWPRTPLCAGTGSMVGDGFMGYCDERQASFPEPRPQSPPRPQATGHRPVNDPPSLCLRGFSSNLHCRIVNRTCCNSLRLKRHENKKREEIKHILWRNKIIDRQRVYTWTTHGHTVAPSDVISILINIYIANYRELLQFLMVDETETNLC